MFGRAVPLGDLNYSVEGGCWLVPRAGAVGAAQALLLTGIVQGLVMAYAVSRVLRHR